MNWPMVSALMTGVLAIAALVNIVILLRIDNSMLKLDLALREWARATFADKAETHERLKGLEGRPGEGG